MTHTAVVLIYYTPREVNSQIKRSALNGFSAKSDLACVDNGNGARMR